jgi:ribose transport system ATP-binding protein
VEDCTKLTRLACSSVAHMPPQERSDAPLLAAKGLAKSYAGHLVLSEIDFTLDRGEAVAVIGENGAGKSTFAKIVAGVIRPDAGELLLDGRSVSFNSPREALRHGIAFIPQELAYVPELTVGENILLGRWPSRFGFVSHRRVLFQAREEARRYGIDLELERRMSDLKLADQQIVEIVKALTRRAVVIVLDEPTAALNDQESQNLFSVIKRLAGEGVGIVYISHRIDEVHRLSDRVDVFRNGRLVASTSPREATPEQLIGHMLGQAAEHFEIFDRKEAVSTSAVSLANWRTADSSALDGIDLEVNRGEVVCLFGVRGCGAEVVAEGLAGRNRALRGDLWLEGRHTALFRTPIAARRANIGYVPSERKKEGLVLPMSISGNIGLLVLRRLSRLGIIRSRLAASLAERLTRQFAVRFSRLSQPVGELSGGNQQKVLLASRLAPSPRVLVLQEPTRGVDVGARLEIHRFLRSICDQGAAILLVTSDVEEAVAVSDRLVIMRNGRVAGELSGKTKTQGQALRLATNA